jgi:hypothetical protein
MRRDENASALDLIVGSLEIGEQIRQELDVLDALSTLQRRPVDEYLDEAAEHHDKKEALLPWMWVGLWR